VYVAFGIVAANVGATRAIRHIRCREVDADLRDRVAELVQRRLVDVVTAGTTCSASSPS
jgi:hypothetical protein